MFRDEVRSWLAEHLVGEFASLGASGGPGREHEGFEVRRRWEKMLGEGGWTCLGWPKEHGGRDATMEEQVIFNEEYVRAGAPVRVGHIGEGLLGPTLIELGTRAQQKRFLPPIVRGEELWCQGYSEPDAGSDLANVKTRAELDGDEWVITGQKVWTSLATTADWCFVVARTEAGSVRHAGLSYLLVPMHQDGIEIRPIVQITGTSEFNEVFFDGARTAAANVVGDVGDGWRVAMATLGFERGVATLGQQVGFGREFDAVLSLARSSGASKDPVMRQRLADAFIGLRLLRYNALRTLHSMADGTPGPEASISKLAWATWHRDLGELAMDVQGVRATLADGFPYDLSTLQRLFLFTRADTIYGGSNEIQRNVIGERALGLPAGAEVNYPESHDLLRGRVVLVTAAAGTGIGFATAKRCAEEGATVVISDRHERRLGEAAGELKTIMGTEPLAVPCDVTDEEQVQALFAAAVAHHDGIDVVVNNAGLGGTANLAEMTDEQWSVVVDVTLNGTMRCTRAALRHMIPRGSGAIVNNASVIGSRAQAGQAHYAAAKAGVMALTRSAAIEAAPHGVRVNAVAPSLAMHEFLSKVTTDELLDELTKREAFGRAAEPWEVANVIVFLASDYASYMTGEVLSVSSQHP